MDVEGAAHFSSVFMNYFAGFVFGSSPQRRKGGSMVPIIPIFAEDNGWKREQSVMEDMKGSDRIWLTS